MPIRVRCSACATQYNLADTLAGKKIRCKKCESVIAVPAAEIEEVTEVVAADEPVPPAKKGSAVKSKPGLAVVRANENDDDEKPRAKRRRDEDDDDEPRLKKKKMSRGLIIGISVGAVVLLAGIGVAIYFMVSGPTLRGERELKELIKAKKEAEAEKDPNKKLEASMKVLGMMLVVEQLKLTADEQSKLKEKYSSQWAELGMDKLLASQNVPKKKEEQKTPPKNDVDSLLAELKTTDPLIKKTEALALIKRLSDNIPVNSPRRSEVFMALRNAATSRSFDAIYASDCTRAAIRYADTGDVDELLKMMQQRELEGNITFSNLIADRLAELKNPKLAEEVALALTNYDINRRRRAAKILRGLGESVEKLVQKSAAPSGNFTGPDLNRRFEAIELLGEIGTQDSLTFLLAIKNEPPTSSEWIADAIKKIRERKDDKGTKDPPLVGTAIPVAANLKVLDSVHTLKPLGSTQFKRMNLSQNGKRMALGTEGPDSITCVWDLSGTPRKDYEVNGILRALSPDGNKMIVSPINKNTQIVDLKTKRATAEIQRFADHFHFVAPDLVIQVGWSHDDREAKPFIVRALSAADGKERFFFKASDDDRVRFTTCNEGREIAIAQAKSNLVKIWDVTSQKLVRDVTLEPSTPRSGWSSFLVNGDAKKIALEGSNFIFCDGENGKTIESHDRFKRPFTGYCSGFIPSGDVYLFASNLLRDVKTGSSVEIVAYDLTRKEVIAVFRGHSRAIIAMAISGDGKFMATADQEGTVKIWDLDRIK